MVVFESFPFPSCECITSDLQPSNIKWCFTFNAQALVIIFTTHMSLFMQLCAYTAVVERRFKRNFLILLQGSGYYDFYGGLAIDMSVCIFQKKQR